MENNQQIKNLVLGNQDVDTSWMTLEVIWNGMLNTGVKEQIGMSFPKSICEIVSGSTINFFVESEGLKQFINLSADKVLNDENLLSNFKTNTLKTAQAIRDYAEEKINLVDKLSNEEIVETLKKIKLLQADCMIYGTVVAFCDVFGAVSNKVSEIINKRENLKYPSHIYSRVLSCSDKTLTEKAYEDITASNLSDDELVQKYFWLNQGYIGRGITAKDLQDIREHIIQKEELPDRDSLLEELHLKPEEEKYLSVLKDIILIKSLRADSRQYLNVVVNKIIDKISVDLNIESNLLGALYTEELCKLIEGDKTVLDKIEDRYNHGILVAKNSSEYEVILGFDADEFLKTRLLREEIENMSEAKGQTANPGKVTGAVKLVFGPQHISKVNDGDILISTATSPQLLPAMKKAAAFVTDVGGITSHAAIVSRELKKPCIVGTKVATKIFKDGDMVEVDADNGIIRIIK